MGNYCISRCVDKAAHGRKPNQDAREKGGLQHSTEPIRTYSIFNTRSQRPLSVELLGKTVPRRKSQALSHVYCDAGNVHLEVISRSNTRNENLILGRPPVMGTTHHHARL